MMCYICKQEIETKKTIVVNHPYEDIDTEMQVCRECQKQPDKIRTQTKRDAVKCLNKLKKIMCKLDEDFDKTKATKKTTLFLHN